MYSKKSRLRIRKRERERETGGSLTESRQFRITRKIARSERQQANDKDPRAIMRETENRSRMIVGARTGVTRVRFQEHILINADSDSLISARCREHIKLPGTGAAKGATAAPRPIRADLAFLTLAREYRI